MASRELKVEIIGDSRSLQKALGTATDSASTFGSKAGKAFKLVGLAAAGAGVAVAGGFIYTLKRGFDELGEAQKVMAQTEAVIKSTGGVANVTARQVEGYATSLSQVSGVDDEVIAAGENMLLTFKNIHNETGKGNDIFKQSTATLLDMSTALGTDMNKSAIQLGKALNDPIKGLTALTRVGVTFTAGQKETIKSLVESGRTMDAQKIILKELNSEFGGSAKAFGETMPGQLAKLRNAFDEMAANLAVKFLPILMNLVQWINDNWGSISAVFNAVGTAISASFNAIGVSVDYLRNQWEIHRETAIATWQAVQGAVQATIAWFQSNVVPAIQNVVTAITAIWNRFGADITSVLRTAFPIILQMISGFVQNVLAPFKIMLALLRGDFGAAWAEIQGIFTRAFALIGSIIRGAVSIWGTAAKALGMAVVDGIWGVIKGLAGKFAAAFGAVYDILANTSVKIAAFAAKIVLALIEPFTHLPWKLGQPFRTAKDAILAQVAAWEGPAAAAAREVGVGISQGVANGMSSMIGVVQAAAAAVVAASVASAQAAARAKSPSREMAEKVGQPLAEGIGAGFMERIGPVGDRASNAVRTVVKKQAAAIREASNEAAAAARELMEKITKEVLAAKDDFASAFGGVISAALSAFDAMASNWKPPSLQVLDRINFDQETKSAVDAITKAGQELQKAREELSKGGTPEEMAKNQEAVLAAEQALADAQLNQVKLNLARQGAVEQEAHDKQMEADRMRLEARLKAIQAKYLKEKDLSQAEVRKMNKEIAAAMGEAGIDAQGAGQNISNMLALGIRSAIIEVRKAVVELANVLRKNLKAKSPTEEGPMSDLDTWWTGLGPSLAAQLGTKEVVMAATGLGTALRNALIPAGEAAVLTWQNMGVAKDALITNLGKFVDQSYVTAASMQTNLIQPTEDWIARLMAAIQQTAAVGAALKALDGTSATIYLYRKIITTNEGESYSPANPMLEGKWPEMAAGGIVRKRTLAWIGEKGAEAVVPLSRSGNLRKFAKALGTAMAAASDSGGGPGGGSQPYGHQETQGHSGEVIEFTLRPANYPPALSRRGGETNITMNFNAPIGGEQDFARKYAPAIADEFRRSQRRGDASVIQLN